MNAFTAAQMRDIDRRTMETFGLPGVLLMEHAGRAVADFILGLPAARHGQTIVLAGGGNNGGDGFVIARHLVAQGRQVTVFLAAPEARVSGDASTHLRSLRAIGGEVRPLVEAADRAALTTMLPEAAVIVDALLGTGLTRPLTTALCEVVRAANTAAGVKVAVDLPTGLDADTGEVRGVAFRADHTFTFGYPKVGLLGYPALNDVGQLHVVDIGIPPGATDGLTPAARLLDEADARAALPRRPPWGHKGTFGHLLLVAGSPGKTGAALLAADAAMRSGAGLVTIACGREAARGLETKTVEVMLAPLTEEADDALDDSAPFWQRFGPHLRGKSAVIVGPGIPNGTASRAFIARLLAECAAPLVIDADGLNALAEQTALLKQKIGPVLLTPHPGEMARLVGLSTAEVQKDRVGLARHFAQAHGVFVVLKGARSVIADPEGDVFVCPTGNAGMGSGGMGDVLSGVIGALLAQGAAPRDALLAGVYAHGQAGDDAARRVGQRGLIARDVIRALARVWQKWDTDQRLNTTHSASVEREV